MTEIVIIESGGCPHCGTDTAAINRKLDAITRKLGVIMSALSDLQAADQSLKDTVAQLLTDLAGQVSGGVSAADAEQIVADLNEQIAALQGADPGPPPAE